jgi:hypothetical protein
MSTAASCATEKYSHGDYGSDDVEDDDDSSWALSTASACSDYEDCDLSALSIKANGLLRHYGTRS